jgi:hypothetical protein
MSALQMSRADDHSRKIILNEQRCALSINGNAGRSPPKKEKIMQKGRTGLDDRHEDLDGRIEQKHSNALNKNLSNPIPQFSGNASVGFMRKETGKVGLNAIRQAAKRRK